MKTNYIFCIALLSIISIIYAIPIQQETIQRTYPEIKQIAANKDVYSTLNRLDKHYSRIINKVFDSNMDELFESVPETFLTIHELQSIGKEYCQTSLFDFVQILEYELKNSRNNLLISIRPLLETNLQSGFDGFQLNVLFDPNQLATRVIDRLYPSNLTGLDRIVQYLKNPYFRLRSRHEKMEASALRAWLHSWLMDIEFALNEELLSL